VIFKFPISGVVSMGRCNTIWYKAVFKGGVYGPRETVWASVVQNRFQIGVRTFRRGTKWSSRLSETKSYSSVAPDKRGSGRGRCIRCVFPGGFSCHDAIHLKRAELIDITIYGDEIDNFKTFGLKFSYGVNEVLHPVVDIVK
jgi:hypothetical protein